MVDTTARSAASARRASSCRSTRLPQRARSRTRASINDVLAGNLCRCTGYGPIVDAAQAMYDLPTPRGGDRRALRGSAQLRCRRPRRRRWLGDDGRRFFAAPPSTRSRDSVRGHPDATFVAGATDVGLWVTKQHRALGTVISIGDVARPAQRVAGLARRMRIGAAATLDATLEARLPAHYPDFGELMRRFGSVQVRNAGTIGGNIANGSPIGDMPPALIALGATLVLRQGVGTPQHAAGGLLHRLRQAGPPARRIRRGGRACRCSTSPIASSLQAVQALRPGHLGRLRRLQHRRARRHRRATPASASAAWRHAQARRRTSRRRSPASPGRRRP